MSNTPDERRNVGDRQIEASISTNSPDILSNPGGKESNSSQDVLVGLSSQKPWRGKRFQIEPLKCLQNVGSHNWELVRLNQGQAEIVKKILLDLNRRIAQ